MSQAGCSAGEGLEHNEGQGQNMLKRGRVSQGLEAGGVMIAKVTHASAQKCMRFQVHARQGSFLAGCWE